MSVPFKIKLFFFVTSEPLYDMMTIFFNLVKYEKNKNSLNGLE